MFRFPRPSRSVWSLRSSPRCSNIIWRWYYIVGSALLMLMVTCWCPRLTHWWIALKINSAMSILCLDLLDFQRRVVCDTLCDWYCWCIMRLWQLLKCKFQLFASCWSQYHWSCWLHRHNRHFHTTTIQIQMTTITIRTASSKVTSISHFQLCRAGLWFILCCQCGCCMVYNDPFYGPSWCSKGTLHPAMVDLLFVPRPIRSAANSLTGTFASSSSSLGGTSLAGRSRLHTPLVTVLCMLPRRVEAEIVLLEVELNRSKPGSLPTAKWPGNFRSQEYSLPGTFLP